MAHNFRKRTAAVRHRTGRRRRGIPTPGVSEDELSGVGPWRLLDRAERVKRQPRTAETPAGATHLPREGRA